MTIDESDKCITQKYVRHPSKLQQLSILFRTANKRELLFASDLIRVMHTKVSCVKIVSNKGDAN